MKVCYENPLKEIRSIVQSRAKYQKVMLLYDDYVSNIEIGEIYESIKDICVYNKSNIKDIDKEELFNGYRLIIYFCNVDNFLKCDFNRDEFVNVFVARDGAIIPYFLSLSNKLDKNENHLLINNSKIDFLSLSCINFNLFFNYFKNLLNGNNFIYGNDFLFASNQASNIGLSNQEISLSTLLQCINSMPENSQFIDIDILKKCDIDYNDLVFVHLLLINAFLLLLTSVKSQNFMIVDVYKSARENDELIEKFYKLYHNEMFTNMVILNYNCLYNFCLKTKRKILELVRFFDRNETKILTLIDKLKNYAKNDNGLIAYLYLYNIFNV